MDKNTITGFILMALVVIAFSWYSQPSEEERQRMMAQQDSIAAVEKQKAENAEKEMLQKAAEKAVEQVADSNALFFAQRQGQEQEIVLKNNKVKITLSTLGGTIQNAEILGFKSRWYEGDVTLMTRKDAEMTFSLAGKQDNIISNQLFFTPVEQTDSSVIMTAQQDGKQLNISYCLQPNSYMVDISLQVIGLDGFFAPNMKTMDISWTDRIMQQEKGYDFENRYSSLTYMRKDKGTKNLSETSDDKKEPEEVLSWVAFKNQFFSAVLIAPQDFTEAQLASTQEKEKQNGFLKTYEAQLKTFFDPTGNKPTKLQMYLGPNDFHTLQAHNKFSQTDKNPELEELVDLGWPIFRWINRWFIMPLFDWLTGFGMNMGIVLLLLTIIVKVLVYPTTKKSFMSSAKMRVLKPQIDALSAKYPKKEDAMKKQQEMMQIYSQYGVSPMGGCLPMLIQMPIWVALFNFVPNAIELRGEKFLWAEDLSAYDDIINWGHNVWLIGDHLSIFCLLFSLTNIINTWISMRQQQNQMSGEQAQQMKMMRYMMYIMPLMFFFMFNNYSSGLCYYYFLSGLTSILIMWFLRKTTDDAQLLSKLEAYREQHKNDPKKVSNLAARLEALQKMQAEQQAKRK
ncbi:MAG: membrane protein insertase YidC [Bacteroidaceae bacterium]|nr:membrane protein insertase YidC [Bacteroidaceae bacterium]